MSKKEVGASYGGARPYNFYRVFDGASLKKNNMLSFSEAEMCAKYEPPKCFYHVKYDEK